MAKEMEDVCEKVCVFEDSLEIDFHYEFDVAKYFDFTRPETHEEIVESERWFQTAGGYPHSPLVVKLDWGTDELGNRGTSSPRYEHQKTYSIDNDSDLSASEISSIDQGKEGIQMQESKSKSPSKPSLPRNSRLLKPTASQLAKQSLPIGVHSTRTLGRIQKLGSPLQYFGEIMATKRQKLEIGYLRKVAQLKHQTSFSHKPPKKVGPTDANSSRARQKVTIPKEPDLETAHRAERCRSNNTTQPGSESKTNSCSFRVRPLNQKGANVHSANSAAQGGTIDHQRTNPSNASMKDKSDPVYGLKVRPFNNKIFSSKRDIGVCRNSKRETTVPREFKLSNSKELPHNPPTELFNKLSLTSEDHPSSLPQKKKPLQTKGLKENVPCSAMKENKIARAVTGKSLRCCPKPSQFGGLRMITDIENHPTSIRSYIIH